MLNKHEKELVKEYATKLIKKRKLTENTLNPSTVLKQLNKASSTRFESGYHYNNQQVQSQMNYTTVLPRL